MPLFGGKREAENEKLHAELARISALPLQQLAAEVMIKGFGAPWPAMAGPRSRRTRSSSGGSLDPATAPSGS